MGLKIAVTGTFTKQPGVPFKAQELGNTRFEWGRLIRYHCRLPALARLLLLAIQWHLKGHCEDGAWPSYQTLCDETGIKSRDTVYKHLERAAEAGWIIVEKRMNNEEHQAHKYFPAIPPKLADGINYSMINEVGQEMIQGSTGSDTPVSNADIGSTGAEQRVSNCGTEESKEVVKEDNKERVSTSSRSAQMLSLFGEDISEDEADQLLFDQARTVLEKYREKSLPKSDQQKLRSSVRELLTVGIPEIHPKCTAEEIEEFFAYVIELENPSPRNFATKTFQMFIRKKQRKSDKKQSSNRRRRESQSSAGRDQGIESHNPSGNKAEKMDKMGFQLNLQSSIWRERTSDTRLKCYRPSMLTTSDFFSISEEEFERLSQSLPSELVPALEQVHLEGKHSPPDFPPRYWHIWETELLEMGYGESPSYQEYLDWVKEIEETKARKKAEEKQKKLMEEDRIRRIKLRDKIHRRAIKNIKKALVDEGFYTNSWDNNDTFGEEETNSEELVDLIGLDEIEVINEYKKHNLGTWHEALDVARREEIGAQDSG